MKKSFSLVLLILMMAMSVAARTFQHPGITYTTADILRMKAQIAAQAEPYYSTYQALLTNGYVSRAASTSKITSITSDDDYNTKLGLPGRCALDNALLYRLTGTESYAQKAVAWLNDLSYITTLDGSTMALSAGKVELLIEAAELMRDYAGWASADKARFKSMLSDVFYPKLKDFDRARWGNQGLTAARAIMAMAVYLDNEDMYARCYAYLTAATNPTTEKYPLGAPTQSSRQSTSAYMYTYNTPTQYGTQEYVYDEALPYYIYDNGQCEESARDQGHAQYGLNLYGNIAEIALNQGDDLYGALSNRILLGFEWTYRYNLDTSWAPEGYVTSGATFSNNKFYKKFSRSKRWYVLKPYDGDRGADYSCGLNREMVLAHYAVRAGLAADKYTYLKLSVDNLISKYGYEQGDVKSSGHYYEFPGWGTLTKRRQTWMAGDPVKNGAYAMHTTSEAICFGDVDRSAIANEGLTQKNVTVSGTKVTAMQQDGWVTYTINVPEAKTYAMKVTYSAEEDAALAVAVDGGAYTNATLATAASETEATLTNITLAKGLHVLRIKAIAETTAQLISFQLTEQEAKAGSPVMEKIYRTKGTNDAWTTLKVNEITKTMNGVDAESHAGNFFEVKYNAGLFAIQKYVVADLDKANKLTVKLYRNEDNSSKFGTMGLWSMANQKWQTSTTFSDIYPYVKAAIGVDNGATTGDYTKALAEGVKSSDGTYQEFTITGDALNTVMQNAVKNADGKYEISLIVTSANPLSTSNFVYNSSQVANGEAVPTCTATTFDPKYPVAEYNYRPKSDGSGWDKNATGTSTDKFECRYGSRLLVVQQYKLLNYSANKEYTITLHKHTSGNAGELAVWDYAAALPANASECNAQCTKVTGVTPGSTDGTNAIDPIATSTCTDNVWTLVIPGSKLTPVSIDANGTATVNVLITTKNLTSGSATNAHYYPYNTASVTEANYPTISEVEHVASVRPVKEYGYRPKASGTGYDALTDGTTGTNTTIEANYQARLFIIQQYEIPDFSKKQFVTLTLTNASNGTQLGVWNYPYNGANDIPTATSVSNETLIANLANVTGYTPWNTSGTKIDPIATASNNGGKYTLTIPASKLTPVAYNAYGAAYVNVLITSTDMTGTNSKAKVYSSNSSNTDANKPVIAIGTYPVYNETTETGYASLKDAVTAAQADDEIEISADQTLTARLEPATDITIKGTTGKEKILRGTDLNNITILVKANVTLQNLIIDGQNIDREKSAIEASTSGNTVTLKDVTVQNFSNTNGNQGIIQLKNNGKMVADGITMINCQAKEGYGCIFVGSNNALTLKGDNGSCGSIFNETSYTIDATEATHTTPLVMSVGTVKEGNTIIKGNNTQRLFTLMNDNYRWLTVGNNLQIASPDVTLTIGDAKCATLVLPFDADLPYDEETKEGVKAYTLTVSGDKIVKEEVSAITANKPVYIEGTKDSYTFTAKGEMVQGENPMNGALTGVYAETEAIPDTYVLQLLNGHPAFYQVAAGEEPTIGKYRAYLTAEGVSGAKVIYFEGDDESTGTIDIEASAADTIAPAYNIAGQRVTSAAKGIVIINGKKYLNR